MSERHQLFFAALMGGLVASLILSGLYVWKVPPRIQILKADLSVLLREEALRISRRQLSPALEKEALYKAKARLQKILAEQYSHIIVLNASGVLSPQVPDVTESISQHWQAEEEGLKP